MIDSVLNNDNNHPAQCEVWFGGKCDCQLSDNNVPQSAPVSDVDEFKVNKFMISIGFKWEERGPWWHRPGMNVLQKEAIWLYSGVMPLIETEKEDARREAANKVFIDIPTGHEITRRTMKTVKHDPKCSSKSGFMCDCEILSAAQYAVDKANVS